MTRRSPILGLLISVCLALTACCGAVSNFNEMQGRAKRAEAPSNLDGLRTAEKAYHAEWDVFTACQATPSAIPGENMVPFEGAGKSCFEALGWTPGVDVRCRYTVFNVSDDAFEATAECDIDGDGVISVYRADQNMKPLMETPNNVY